MMWWDGNWEWGAWLAMTLLMLAFWGIVAWAVVAVVRDGTAPGSVASSDPERVLAERFAAGEIDRDEYRERLETLRSTGATGKARASR
jgi:putative membrane protein